MGATLFSVQVNGYQDGKNYQGEYAVCGRVIYKEKDRYGYIVTLDKLYVEGEETAGVMQAYMPYAYYTTIELADTLLMEGNVRTNTRLFGEYGFRAYAVEEDIRYTMNVKKCVKAEEEFYLFLYLRGRMEKVIYSGMDETPAAVTMATLTGNTSRIEEGLLDNIRRGGIAHIFAVSGLHIGALYAFCLWIIHKTKLRLTPKYVRFFILLATLLLYGGICGFSASVVRAIVMCALLYLSKLAGYGNDSLETISAAAIVVLILSPVSLFSVGFQLSFAACYGIALFSRPLYKGMYRLGDFIRHDLLRRERKPFVLEEDTHPLNNRQRMVRAVVSFLSVTIAAQIATTPIQIAAFSSLSVWSLLLNCLFVPIISAIFSVMLLFVFVACLFPITWSFVFLYLPNVVWSALLLLFECFSFTTITVATFPLTATCSYYTAITFCSGRWNVEKKILVTFALLFITLFVCSLVIANV